MHAKIQGRRPFGAREDFLRFVPYMGMAVILFMWPGPFDPTFVSISQGGYTWNFASICLAVIEERKFENIESEWINELMTDLEWPMNDLDLWYS